MSGTILWLTLASVSPCDAPLPSESVALPDYAACGVNSLYVASRLLGTGADLPTVQKLVGPPQGDGSHSLEDLRRAASALGLHPVCVTVDRHAAEQLPTPAIVQIVRPSDLTGPAHFMVVLRADPDRVYLLDPPAPQYAATAARFAEFWTGNALVFAAVEADANELAAGAGVHGSSLWWLWWCGCAAVSGWGLWAAVRQPGGLGGLPSVPPQILHLTRRTAATTIGRIAAAVAVVSLAVGIGTLGRGHADPTLEFESSPLDLGDLPPGDHRAELVIANRGRVRLQIGNVTTSCTCASAVAPTFVDAGERQPVTLMLKVGSGPQTARVRVSSNDPRGDRVAVVGWRGLVPASLAPASVIAPHAPATTAYRRTIRLMYPGGLGSRPPELERVECDCQGVRVAVGADDPVSYPLAGSLSRREYVGALGLTVDVEPPQAGASCDVLTSCVLHLRQSARAFEVRLPVCVHFDAPSFGRDGGPILFTGRDAAALVGQRREISLDRLPRGASVELRGVPEWLSCSVETKGAGDRVLAVRLASRPPVQPARHTIRAVGADGRTTVASADVFVCCGRP